MWNFEVYKDFVSSCVFHERVHMSEVADQDSGYLRFCSMKRLGVFLLNPRWDASPLQRYPLQ